MTAYKEGRHGTPYLPIAAYETYPGFADEFNNSHIDCHYHDEWEFFLVETGSAYYGLNGFMQVVSAGDVIFIPAGNLHLFNAVDSQPWQFKAVVFSQDIIMPLHKDLVETKYIRPLIDGEFTLPIAINAADILAKFSKLHNLVTNKPPIYEIRIKAVIWDLLAHWLENAHKTSQKFSGDKVDSFAQIKSTLEYIHVHYNQKICVDELAKIAHMSAGYFARMFKYYTTKSPMDYVIKIRLSKAAALLENSDDKLLKIALDTGFNNLSYFIRIFARNFGCSPSEYRRRLELAE
ncbi:MAG: AraC family transcriptional regulator [Firmicutes bacterium]|nr:AraC family transcriptional regulator [Bacillota bacterium]